MLVILLQKIFFCLSILLASDLSANTRDDNYFIAAIPKCGNDLLIRSLRLLTGKHAIVPREWNSAEIEKSVHRARQESAFLKCHVYIEETASTLSSFDYKCIFIYRDPRDALISLLFYMDQLQHLGLQRDFYLVPDGWDDLSFDEKLTALLVGKKCESYVARWFAPMIQWISYPHVLSIRFEDLVGEHGGGSSERQRQQLNDIVEFISLEIDETKLNEVAETLYYRGATNDYANQLGFERGQIGNWRYFFNAQHKELFKTHFNDLLISLGYEIDMNW